MYLNPSQKARSEKLQRQNCETLSEMVEKSLRV